MGKNLVIGMFILALLAGCAFAAEPVIQITNYSSTPSSVYPGTKGYLQITLANVGDSSADSVAAYSYIDGVQQSSTVGDIASGTSAKASVPFKISQDFAGGIQLLNIDVYYTYSDTKSGTSSKKSTLSIPLVVSQYQSLEVTTLPISDLSVSPGERMQVQLALRNKGGVVNNVLVSVPDNSSFYIDSSSQQSAGSIAANSSTEFSLVLVSSSNAPTGTYSIPVTFTYQDALNQPTTKTVYIGPISVLESSSVYRLSIQPLSAVEIGSQVPFSITLQNTGSSDVSATVELNSTDVFSPIGMQQVYFDLVPAHSSVSANVTIGVSSSASAGYYSLPAKLTPSMGQASAHNVGIAVSATPEITISLVESGTTKQVQITNTGNSQIRSVRAIASQNGKSIADSFMGTLNVDDYASLSVSSASSSSMDVEVTFKDSTNQPHSIKQTLSSASSFAVAGGLAQAGTNAATNSATTGNFAARSRQGSGLLGPLSGSGSTTDLALPAAFAIVLAVAGFFAYKRFFAKPKAKGQPIPPAVPVQPPAQQAPAHSKAKQK